jgi:hypothetical protein
MLALPSNALLYCDQAVIFASILRLTPATALTYSLPAGSADTNNIPVLPFSMDSLPVQPKPESHCRGKSVSSLSNVFNKLQIDDTAASTTDIQDLSLLSLGPADTLNIPPTNGISDVSRCVDGDSADVPRTNENFGIPRYVNGDPVQRPVSSAPDVPFYFKNQVSFARKRSRTLRRARKDLLSLYTREEKTRVETHGSEAQLADAVRDRRVGERRYANCLKVYWQLKETMTATISDELNRILGSGETSGLHGTSYKEELMAMFPHELFYQS